MRVSTWAGAGSNSTIIEIVTTLGSILAFSTVRKRILTPQRFFCEFGGDKFFTTSWSGSRVQVWMNSLIFFPPSCSRKYMKALTAKSMADLFWQAGSVSAQLWQLDFQMQTLGVCKSVAVSAGHNRLALPRGAATCKYWLSSRVKGGFKCIANFRQWWQLFFFIWKWNFNDFTKIYQDKVKEPLFLLQHQKEILKRVSIFSYVGPMLHQLIWTCKP